MTLLKGKRRSPNIVRGGRAIPFGNPNDNLYYLQGRSHAKGGIDIGANPRTGIEAEGGEVVQIKPNELRVLSAQDFIGGGVSPAKQVLAGANPDKVFNNQERFKDRHRINDDGSKYETGGNKTLKNITRFLFPVPSLIYDAVNYFRNKDDNNNNEVDVNETIETKSVKTGQLPYGYSIRNLYEFENPRRKGIKGKTAKAYDSRTIGAGIDFVSGHPELKDRAKKGIPVQEVNDTAVTHLRNDDKAIMNAYADKYGQAAADTVSHGPRFLAAQARYQQGNIRRVTSKVIKAMAEGNADNLKDAVLEITPKGHKHRQNLVRNFEVYPSKKLNGGMIATINGNVKNGLISTPRPKAKGGTDIHIKPSKRGTFTAAAKAHGKSVQGFASQVLANKDNYSSAMVKKANFARNASKWNHKAYGGRKKFEPGGNKTITDVDRGDKKNDKIWLETFGTDSDILNRARYDTEAMNAMARRHADLVEASGYNPDSGKAIQYEGVGQYQQDFNSKFWNPNRRLYNEITPAGNSGDNQLGSFNDKDYMGNMTYLRTPTGLYTPETVEFWRRKGFRATNYKGDNQLEYMLNPLKTPNIDINVSNPKLPDLSPIGRNTPPTGGQDKTPQSPTPRRGIRWNDDLTSLAGNVLGSLGSFGADLWGSNLRSWNPYTESPVKLKTNWNINPQLDRIRESSQEAYRDIDANTASSSTALARKQRVRNQAQYAANEQWGTKENKETELINKDKLNLQGVRNRNTNRLNYWAESDANIANMRRRLRGAAVSDLFDNLNKSLQGYIGRRDQRRRDEATERMFNKAYPHGAAMARDIQSRESRGDATIPSLATNPIAIAGRLATERLDDDIVAQTKKRCGGKTKRK